MTQSAPRDGMRDLFLRLAGAHRIAVIGIGDELSPSDRLGILAARAIDDMGISGIRVFLAGTVPESMTGPVKAFRPDHILLLDAAEMGKPPGTAGILDPGTVSAGLLSTHVIPLQVVMEYLEQETGAAVTLLGIQPETTPAPGTSRNDEKTEGEREDRGEGRLSRMIADLECILRNVRKNRPVQQ